jgi:hypothetical protein
MAAAVADPRSRLTLTNVATAQRIEAMYNPQQWEFAIQANWNFKAPPGASYERLQFGSTSSPTMNLELFYDVVTQEDLQRREEAEKFISALMHPRRGAGAIPQHSPPRVLIVWPNGPSMQCVLLNLSARASRFNNTGDAIEEAFTLQLKEFRESNIFSEDAAEYGFRRAPRSNGGTE